MSPGAGAVEADLTGCDHLFTCTDSRGCGGGQGGQGTARICNERARRACLLKTRLLLRHRACTTSAAGGDIELSNELLLSAGEVSDGGQPGLYGREEAGGREEGEREGRLSMQSMKHSSNPSNPGCPRALQGHLPRRASDQCCEPFPARAMRGLSRLDPCPSGQTRRQKIPGPQNVGI